MCLIVSLLSRIKLRSVVWPPTASRADRNVVQQSRFPPCTLHLYVYNAPACQSCQRTPYTGRPVRHRIIETPHSPVSTAPFCELSVPAPSPLPRRRTPRKRHSKGGCRRCLRKPRRGENTPGTAGSATDRKACAYRTLNKD